MTRKIKEVSKLFDINLLDHLIITIVSYYSFTDESTL
ncbi:JAB domain-containing protein [Myroides sp. TSA_177.3]